MSGWSLRRDGGEFARGAAPAPLTASLYNPSFDKDKFENTALTIEGRAGALKLVYAGAYLVRNVEQVQDYTNYARGLSADYYQCGSPTNSLATVQCYTLSPIWHDRERNTHLSQELRVSTSAEGRSARHGRPLL